VEVHKVVRRRGSHIFWTVGSHMAVKCSMLTRRPLLSCRKICGAHFCQKLIQLQDHSAAGRIMYIDKQNYLIGNRTRDFPTCSIVPQPNVLTRVPLRRFLKLPLSQPQTKKKSVLFIFSVANTLKEHYVSKSGIAAILMWNSGTVHTSFGPPGRACIGPSDRDQPFPSDSSD
jgi:hypothetical protein